MILVSLKAKTVALMLVATTGVIVTTCFSFSTNVRKSNFITTSSRNDNNHRITARDSVDEGYVIKQRSTKRKSLTRVSFISVIPSTTCLYSSNIDSVGDLTSALARIDHQWQIQQKNAGPKSRWKKLQLTPTTASNNDIGSYETTSNEQQPSPPQTFVSGITDMNDYVYLLEPPYNSIPSCIIVFTGGAGLGTYPQIAYNELLLRLSNRLNAVVITAPYQVGLDHFMLAKETGDKARRAIIQCQDDPSRLYSPTTPVYSLSHSLGSKLSAIYIAATGLQYDGVGFMSFNNFGFGQTIGMAREFAQMIRNGSDDENPALGKSNIAGVSEEMINNFFSFAETAVSAIGLEFVPKPTDMERLISNKFTSDRLSKVRLFAFDDDQLDNTQQFVYSAQSDVAVSGLPGTHLAPVYFKLSLDEILSGDAVAAAGVGVGGTFPPEARDIAKEAMGGFESASFGNEQHLNGLVDEICDWIKGKDVSRIPTWLRERPKLSGS
jgi:Protein of unknown function (DUF1350)